MYIVQLICGDISGDGHEKTEIFTINSSLDKTRIENAYNKGVKITGIDITSMCYDYRDSSISRSVINTLKEFNEHLFNKYNKLYDFFEYPVEEGIYLYSESFIGIYLWISEIGDSSFQYNKLRLECINTGGYGLF